MIGLFLLINGIAISLTQVWNADHIIALLLGNILLIAAYFYFVGIYKLSKKLFDFQVQIFGFDDIVKTLAHDTKSKHPYR